MEVTPTSNRGAVGAAAASCVRSRRSLVDESRLGRPCRNGSVKVRAGLFSPTRARQNRTLTLPVAPPGCRSNESTDPTASGHADHSVCVPRRASCPDPRRPFSTGNAPPSPASKNRKRLLPTESLHAGFVSVLLAQVLRSPSSDLRRTPANEAPRKTRLTRLGAKGRHWYLRLRRPDPASDMRSRVGLRRPARLFNLAGCSPELKGHMPPTDFCNRMRPASTPCESSRPNRPCFAAPFDWQPLPSREAAGRGFTSLGSPGDESPFRSPFSDRSPNGFTHARSTRTPQCREADAALDWNRRELRSAVAIPLWKRITSPWQTRPEPDHDLCRGLPLGPSSTTPRERRSGQPHPGCLLSRPNLSSLRRSARA